MSLCPLVWKFLVVVGAAKVFFVVWGFLRIFVDTVVPRSPQVSKYLPNRPGQPRSWAVVTGSTAGIGNEFAHQLAKAGFNVALVSRTQSKLEDVSQQIATKYKVETAVFALDSSIADVNNFNALQKWVQSLGSVTTLVNNVGQSHEMPVPFTETDREEMHNIIQVNNVATLETTRAVLPQITRYIRETKGQRGLVLTVGSFAGLTPTPLLATYAGSKAFLQSWSNALGAEMKDQGVDVQLVISYLVTSNMSKIRRTSLMIPDPRAFVASVLRSIGRRGGAQERAFTMTPYWSHAVFHYVIENVFGVYSELVSRINLSMHKDIRRRALRKQAKTQ